MLPTLKVGDFLFVSKFPYGYGKYSFPLPLPFIESRIFNNSPDYGDIIVYKGVKDPETYYIKRVVGLPGDTIQVKEGILYVNDKPSHLKYISHYSRTDNNGDEKVYDKYVELMPNGFTHYILDANINNHKNFPDTTPIYTVPKGYYFFMGDNRNNSIDSRFINEVGYIPEENLVGRADFIFWTADFSIINLITEFDTARAFSIIK